MKKKELKKLYKNTGDSSIAVSVVSFILSLIPTIGKYSFYGYLAFFLISFFLLGPFYYFGKKIKESGIKDFEYALKISTGMLIYTFLIILANYVIEDVFGFWWLLLLYYYYKSYNETKKYISNK
ncbi:MAG: hypothetical protein ABH819_00650 [Patescibacteria group bacterium]